MREDDENKDFYILFSLGGYGNYIVNKQLESPFLITVQNMFIKVNLASALIVLLIGKLPVISVCKTLYSTP